MKKSELIKLIEKIGDDQDINETILGIEDFAKSSEIDVNKLSLEDFKKVITDNKEIKGYYTGEKEIAVKQGVKTYEENILPKKIEEAIKAKSNEGKTPEQIKLEETTAKVEALEKQLALKDSKANYSKVLADKKLSADLLDFINLDEKKENIDSSIDKLSKIINDSINAGVKERMGGKDETPPRDDNDNLSLEQQIAQAMGIK